MRFYKISKQINIKDFVFRKLNNLNLSKFVYKNLNDKNLILTKCSWNYLFFVKIK